MRAARFTPKFDAVTVGMLVILVLLLVKFFIPFFRYEVPLGYDLGIYRYLFLKYAEAWPPLSLPELPAWGREHPVGLFIFSSLLMKTGMPVDWLTGWIWNLFPVLLASALAWVTAREHGRAVGAVTLLCALLSVAYFDGFAAMYWKTYASLLCVVFAFHFARTFSWWLVLFSILAVAIHHQTGLLLAVTLGSWWALHSPTHWKDPKWGQLTILLVLGVAVAIALYLPSWHQSFWGPLKGVLTLRGTSAPAGSFPDILFYLRTSGLLLLTGIAGFVMTIRREWRSPWSLAVLWCLIFVFGKLVFHNRFILQLDFFLLPFAARAIVFAWQRGRHILFRLVIIAAILVQLGSMFMASWERRPITDREEIAVMEAAAEHLKDNTLLLALENRSAVVLRGWLIEERIEGPGLFGQPWTYQQWEQFLLGTHQERKALLETLKGTVYIYDSPYFHAFYKERADVFLADPCFRRSLTHPALLFVTCRPPPPKPQ